MLKHYMADMADQAAPRHEGPESPRKETTGTFGKTFQLTRRWEHRRLDRSGPDTLLSEDELNALGVDGWELAAVVSDAAGTHYFLKRARGG